MTISKSLRSASRLAVGALLVSGSSVAVAQTAVSAPEDATPEIIVTAQLRQESMQKVPLSVSVLSAKQIATLGINNLSKVSQLAPGFTFGSIGSNAQVSIRGARTEAVLVNVEPVIGFYADGIYRPSTEQALSPFVDVARIEVLRGPQGTLFGRNTYGGAINVISARPDSKPAAELTASLGNYNTREVSGFINLPLNNVFSLRVSGGHFSHDGYVRNTLNPSNSIEDRDENFGRIQLLIAPSTRLHVLLKAEYLKQGGNGDGAFSYYTPGTLRAPGTDGVATLADPSSVSGVLIPINTLGGAALTSTAGDSKSHIARNNDFLLDAHQLTTSAELTWQLPFADLFALGAYTEFRNLHTGDADFSPFQGVKEGQYDRRKTWQQEVRLSSHDNSRFSWLVGAFLLQDRATDSYYFAQKHLSTQGQDLDDNPIVNTDADAANKVVDPAAGPGYFFANRRYKDTDSYAGYGQVSYALFENKLKLTSGIRYSYDKQKFTLFDLFADQTAAPANFTDTSFSLSNPAVTKDAQDHRSFKAVTWRGVVTYQPNNAHNLYFSASSGFASGGFNSVANPLTGSFSYGPQHDIAYELGSKNSFFVGKLRINGALFYNDYRQILAELALNIPTTIVYDAIGGNGHSYGLEMEGEWTPTRDLDVSAQFTATRAIFDHFLNGTGSGVAIGNTVIDGIPFERLDGMRIPYSPTITARLSIDYAIYRGSLGRITPGISAFYSTAYGTSDQPYAGSRQGSYSKTNLHVNWSSASDRFAAEAFVDNIENNRVLLRTLIYSQAQLGQQFGSPRTFGVRLTARY